MLDKTKSTVSTVGRENKVEKITISDINECNESDTYGEVTIDYPYEIEFSDSSDKVIMKEKSQSSLRAKNWDKKFRFNDKGYASFWRYQSLLAVATLKVKSTGKDLPKELDLNDLVGYEFDGVIVRLDKGDFIDWVATFEVNDIPVPVKKSETTENKSSGAW